MKIVFINSVTVDTSTGIKRVSLLLATILKQSGYDDGETDICLMDKSSSNK